jgi:glucuronate isomerase
MKVTITIDVRDDGFRHHTYVVEEDQEPFSVLGTDRPDRPVERIRRAAIARTKAELERLLRQAEA